MTALQVTTLSYPRTTNPEEIEVRIAVAVGTEDPKTRYVCTLSGTARDYLDTLVAACHSAYMYEETPAHVVRAAAALVKLAKAHALTHDF